MSFRGSKENWLGSALDKLRLSGLEAAGYDSLPGFWGDFVASLGRKEQGRWEAGNRPAELIYFKKLCFILGNWAKGEVQPNSWPTSPNEFMPRTSNLPPLQNRVPQSFFVKSKAEHKNTL